MGMHDTRVDVIVANAFNGMGDSTGEDDFGISVAWIDLDDFVEDYGMLDVPDDCRDDSDKLSAWLKTWEHVDGSRYVLAYIDANGSRSVLGFKNRDKMMAVYRSFESDYLEWLEASE